MVKLLKPGDVINYYQDKSGVYGWLYRRIAGEFAHTSIYVGEVNGEAKVIEAVARGVILSDLFADKRRVAVYEPTFHWDWVRKRVVEEAFKILGDAEAWYDYAGVAKMLLWKLLLRHLGFNVYRKDTRFWCSELVCEVYWRAGFPIYVESEPPLPSDLAMSKALRLKWEGYLARLKQ